MEKTDTSFEDQWSEAFEGAEKSPPDHVWASIDGALANAEAKGYKKRVIFFKWVAAASVLLAMLFGAALLNGTLDGPAEVAQTDTQEQNVGERDVVSAGEQSTQDNLTGTSDTEITKMKLDDVVANSPQGQKMDDTAPTSADASEATSSDLGKKQAINQSIAALSGNEPDKNLGLTVDETEEAVSPLVENGSAELAYIQTKKPETKTALEPWVADHLYGVPDLSAGKLDTNDKFGLWAGISLSSGSFNPETGEAGNGSFAPSFADAQTSFDNITSVNTVPLRSEYVTGNAFSAGMDMGGQVAKRIRLSSGIHYSAVSPGSSSNIIVTDRASNKTFALSNESVESASLDEGLRSGDLEVSQGVTNFSNTLQYLTIPLKAGYVVLDRKLNVILNSGVSTNFLIGSSLNNSKDGVQNFGSSEASDTFSSTYLDLLTSIELGYRLMDRYHLSLEPNYRKAISSFTKEDSSIEGRPTNFGVSIGIKYNF
ncbi:MAG: hypothetical protein RIG77_17245 [Cyclobacteriaceae bacterium]